MSLYLEILLVNPRVTTARFALLLARMSDNGGRELVHYKSCSNRAKLYSSPLVLNKKSEKSDCKM